MRPNETRITSLQDRKDDMTLRETDVLISIHRLLAEVKLNPRSEKYDPVQFIEDMEYTLQGIWGFNRDKNFHTHWLDIKGCKCPHDDNLERIPHGRIINLSCPWHGTKEETQ